MEPVTDKNLLERLEHLNWHYGKGEIRDVSWTVPGQSGTAEQRIWVTGETMGEGVTRKFTVTGTTLRFLGHQSNLAKPFRV